MRSFLATHPRIAAFAVLAIAMAGVLYLDIRNVALAPGEYVAFVVSTVLLATLCVWIISWE